MQITDIQTFLKYYEKIRSRTLKVIHLIPSDKIDWTYHEDKFTFGEMIRHLAAIERFMYAETVQLKPSSYPGCGTDLADGYEATLQYFHDMHKESMDIFSKLTEEDLNKKCVTPGGIPITLWKWLRAMVEHEVHHRGQLYTYLGMLDIGVPPIFGLTSEEVLERSKSK